MPWPQPLLSYYKAASSEPDGALQDLSLINSQSHMASKKQKDTPFDDYANRSTPDPEEITVILDKESDRGVILICIAYLEEILGALISNICVSNTLADTILQVRKPAGDFEGRILLSQALGLIHENEVKNLRILQKIRNKAAHFDRGGRGFDVLFDSDSTIDFVLELGKNLGIPTYPRQPALIRDGFIVATQSLAATLLQRRVKITRTIAPKSTREIAEQLLISSQGTLIGSRLARLKLEVNDIMFLPYAGMLQVFIDKAISYEREYGTKVSEEEILNEFDKYVIVQAK
jgi:DNA-binding MltR family transcriptional regulator